VIPRYQRILFWSLIGCVLLMFAFLLRGCEQVHKRLKGTGNLAPLSAPNANSPETVTFYLASDADASITPTQRQVALPAEPTIRARALLENLITQYGDTESAHPLKQGSAVADIFLLTMPSPPPTANSTNRLDSLSRSSTGETAVINLRGSFADNHPSGVVVETLTLQSIIGTLHAALPQIDQVRFLVDGKPRETLAGHASLLRAYQATDTANRPLVPLDSK
jgi:hypothetical protein